jgi:DNA-binding LacI/PurR family transcriptional regulator
MTKTSTIKDVAKQAAVSIATVSFVLNERSGQSISDEVRRRVLRAARDLHYHANAAAADLARKRTNNVAIIFYKEEELIANAFYSFVVQGAIKQAIEREYNLLFSYIGKTYGGVSDLPKVIREKNAQGALFINRVNPRLLRDIQARGIPVVAIDHFPQVTEINSLEIDNVHGGALAAEHLIELGHVRLGFLRAAAQRPSIAERGLGFSRALARHDLNTRGTVIEAQSLSFEGAHDEAQTVLRRKRRPTALFCANDEMAAGVLRAAYELGIRVPEELSVVGFDDITMSNFTDPPLTTVSVVKEHLGRRAMTRLLELVEGTDREVKHENVTVQLVVRGSTAPPCS